MSFLAIAREALGRGYSCFPVLCFVGSNGKREKRPLVDKWTKYAIIKPTEEELAAWAATPQIEKFAGIGIPTGAGFGVIDFDASCPISFDDISSRFEWYDPEKFPSWVRTGGGGLHIYVKGDIRNTTNIFSADKHDGGIAVDTRGVGGFVVGPGSVLWSSDPMAGEATAVTSYTGNLESPHVLPECPEEILSRARVSTGTPPAYARIESEKKIPHGKGERHSVALSAALAIANRAKTGEQLTLLKKTFEQLLRDKFENTNPDEEEYQRIWETAAQKVRKERGTYWSTILPVVNESIRKEDTKNELNKWGFRVLKAQRISELLRMTVELEDGSIYPVQLEVKDLYQQTRFREAFTCGTNKVLEKIKSVAFEKFIQTLIIEEVRDVGITASEILSDVLVQIMSRLKESADEEEVSESLKTRGYARVGNNLRIKLSRLRSEYELRAIRPSAMVQALQDIGSKQLKKGIWQWERP